MWEWQNHTRGCTVSFIRMRGDTFPQITTGRTSQLEQKTRSAVASPGLQTRQSWSCVCEVKQQQAKRCTLSRCVCVRYLTTNDCSTSTAEYGGGPSMFHGASCNISGAGTWVCLETMKWTRSTLAYNTEQNIITDLFTVKLTTSTNVLFSFTQQCIWKPQKKSWGKFHGAE